MARLVKLGLPFILSLNAFIFSNLSYGLELVKAEGLTPQSVRYRVDFKDGSDLSTAMAHLPLLTEFQKSNLFRGLMIRMNALLGALPSKEKPSWKGKLADFLVSQALAHHAVSIWYFQAAPLVSPIGLSIRDLGDTEKIILKKIVEATRTDKNRQIEFNHVAGEVTPISITTQRIAVAFSHNCIGVSRDPIVARASADSCAASTAPSHDMTIELNVESMSASTSKVLTHYLGIGPWLTIDFKKSGDGQLTIIDAHSKLTANHAIKNMQISSGLLDMLPASTLFYSSFAIPTPTKWSKADIKHLLLDSPTVSSQTAVTFFYLGMNKTEKSSTSEVGILIPQSTNKIALKEMTSLLQSYYSHEVFAREICSGKAIAISPQQSVLDKIDQSCSKKIPNLSHASSDIAKAMASPTAAHTIMFNLGQILTAALTDGMILDQATDKLSSEEVVEAQNLLKKIPALFLSGSVNGDELKYQAYTGVF